MRESTLPSIRFAQMLECTLSSIGLTPILGTLTLYCLRSLGEAGVPAFARSVCAFSSCSACPACASHQAPNLPQLSSIRLQSQESMMMSPTAALSTSEKSLTTNINMYLNLTCSPVSESHPLATDFWWVLVLHPGGAGQ